MKALFTLSTNLIPVMDFEREFMAVSGTTLDQARFALAFIGALVSGFCIRGISNPKGGCSAVRRGRACLNHFLTFEGQLKAVLLPCGKDARTVVHSPALDLVGWNHGATNIQALHLSPISGAHTRRCVPLLCEHCSVCLHAATSCHPSCSPQLVQHNGGLPAGLLPIRQSCGAWGDHLSGDLPAHVADTPQVWHTGLAVLLPVPHRTVSDCRRQQLGRLYTMQALAA